MGRKKKNALRGMRNDLIAAWRIAPWLILLYILAMAMGCRQSGAVTDKDTYLYPHPDEYPRIWQECLQLHFTKSNNMKSLTAYYDCSCEWEGPFDSVMVAHEGLLCPECGEQVNYVGKQEWHTNIIHRMEDSEAFAEFGFLCLGCGNDDQSLFEGDTCLNCQKIAKK